MVIFGLAAYLLPFILLFPNTAKTLSTAFSSSGSSSGKQTGKAAGNDLEKVRAMNSVRSLPEVLIAEHGEQLVRQRFEGDTAVYFDESRNEVLITNAIVYETWAGTNIGNVRWIRK